MTKRERQLRALGRREADVRHWRGLASAADNPETREHAERKERIAQRDIVALRTKLGLDTSREG
jgi:hypothetical protein